MRPCRARWTWAYHCGVADGEAGAGMNKDLADVARIFRNLSCASRFSEEQRLEGRVTLWAGGWGAFFFSFLLVHESSLAFL